MHERTCWTKIDDITPTPMSAIEYMLSGARFRFPGRVVELVDSLYVECDPDA